MAVEKLSVYYANRSMCHIKMENYGLSLNDGLESVKLNKDYVKAYYRVGSASIVLGKVREAYDAFVKVIVARSRRLSLEDERTR